MMLQLLSTLAQQLTHYSRVVGMNGVCHISTDHQGLGDCFLKGRRVILISAQTTQHVFSQ